MSRTIEREAPRPSRLHTVLRLMLVVAFLYLFLGGMAMMGSGLKELGKNPAFDADRPAGPDNQMYRSAVYHVFAYADSPIVGLFIGVLATSVFQSSSFTTSLTVSLVATTPLTLHQAIFIVMGANIGTSVTNTGASFSHIRRTEEFERAYGAAIVHDFFNVLSVILLMPIEWVSWRITGRGVLERAASGLASFFYRGAPAGRTPTNWLKTAVNPLVEGMGRILEDGLGLSHVTANVALAAVGVFFLFASLVMLTKTLRRLVLKRVEQLFDRVLFRNAATAYVVGLVLTFTVQSSSITTSLAVPLVGAGLLSIYQVYPYMLGANLGTTFTALIASFATSADTPAQAQVGVALAFSHMIFNVAGTLVWYPLRRVPVEAARWHARHVLRSKRWAVLHVVVFFFVLPVLVIALYWLIR